MTTFTRIGRKGFALTAAFLLAGAYGIAEQAQPFTPRVGQPGKDVVWVPTSQALVEKMLDMAQVTANDVVTDLGSGDGRTVIAAAKRGARAFGVEYNADMVELSRNNAAEAGVADKARFVNADLFQTDLSQSTVITMFLLPDINIKLRPTILALKPGTRIVSNSFDMQDWRPDDTATIEGECESWCTALLWIVPARVEGKWRVEEGELALKQEFQMISGTVTLKGAATPIVNGRLRGDQISFTVGNAQYTGRVTGGQIEGTVLSGGNTRPWHGTRVNA